MRRESNTRRTLRVSWRIFCGTLLPRFDASVIGRRGLDVIWRPLPPILKGQLQVFQRTGLIAFHGEMVMAPAPNNVVRQIALGQQSVGRHVLALQVDGL